MAADKPENERDRLLSLRAMHVLDTPPEQAFDGLVRAASVIAGTPIALVSLVDADRQWFKARVGLDATETSRDQAFCAHAILRPEEPMVVADASSDPRFASNPLVLGDPNIRFYAGFPISDDFGRGLGTLCVIDRVPRDLDEAQIEMLSGLAAAAQTILRTRQLTAELSTSRRLSMLFRRGFDAATVGMQLVSPQGDFLLVNQSFAEMVGRRPEDLVGRHWRSVTHPDDFLTAETVADELATGVLETHRELIRFPRPHGGITWGMLNVVPVEFEGSGERVYFSQVTDVTETIEARLTAERLATELAISERRMSALVEPAPDPTIRLDEHRRIAAANPAAADLLGVAESELPGRLLGEVMTDQFLRQAVETAVERVVESGEPAKVDRVLVGQGAALPAWSSVRVNPVDGIPGVSGRDVFVVISDVTENVENELRLTAMALIDPLTGVSNRAALFDRFEHALARLDRATAGGIAVVVIDLDHFKSINDSFGHRIGDQALLAVAKVLTEALREQDTVGRLGGDEFLLLIEDVADLAAAELIAGRVSEVLGGITIPTPDGPVRVGGSLGLAWTGTRVDAHELVAAADRALFQAKRRGRGQVWVAGAEEPGPFRSNAALLRDLGGALGRGQFEMYFQPIVDPAGLLHSYEALLRWNHPELGLLAPDVFLSGLMETGLIGPVGQWMLKNVIATLAAEIADEGARVTPIHVNLSPAEVGNPHLPRLLRSLLHDYAVPAELLTVELTEKALARTMVSSSAMSELAQTGVRIALDDFGTGASSLIHLRHRPLHAVKLDRGFVAGLADDARDRSILKGTISMARDLGLDVIAEGVETVAQHDWLVERGCTHLQGWYHGQPAPWKSLETV